MEYARVLTKGMFVACLRSESFTDAPMQGELDELLGKVQPSYASYPAPEGQTLPDFPPDESHPYHLVVV